MALHHARTSIGNYRAHDPSQLSNFAFIRCESNPQDGTATLILSQAFTLKGLPKCTLTGGGHAGPIPCIDAQWAGTQSVILTFAEGVSEGDIITFPYKDQAIKSHRGWCMVTDPISVGSTFATHPDFTSGDYSADENLLSITFRDAILPTGTSVAKRVNFTTHEGVQASAVSIGFTSGNVAAFYLEAFTNSNAADTSTSSGIGAAIVGAVGGLEAIDWTDEAITTSVPSGAPVLIGQSFNPDTLLLTLYWSTAVVVRGDANDCTVIYAGHRYVSTGPATSPNAATCLYTLIDIDTSTDPSGFLTLANAAFEGATSHVTTEPIGPVALTILP